MIYSMKAFYSIANVQDLGSRGQNCLFFLFKETERKKIQCEMEESEMQREMEERKG